MPERETDRFEAVAPDGSTHTIVEITIFTATRYLSGPSDETRGSSRYCLDPTDQEVTPVQGDPDEFMILPDGPIVRRIR